MQSDDTLPPPQARPLGMSLALVLLADVLFWGHAPGLSLALFAAATFAASTTHPRPLALGVLLLSALPVVDYVQTLSVLILTLGTLAAIAMTQTRSLTLATTLTATLHLSRTLPLGATRDLIQATRTLHPPGPLSTARHMARAWAFPLGGTLVLLSLLVQANPILDTWLTALVNPPLDPLLWLERALFWSGVALLTWPLVNPKPAPTTRLKPLPLPNLGLNATSVANALLAFNAVLALQSLMDARYLWTGAQLPPGMTLAEYAHRGAYPLLATALLAGAFALAARPFVAERRSLKPMLILWLAQNILLTLSALYRLDLYVAAFGLTYLRVHALIWMALVATGLTLTLAQIATAKSNLWLLTRCTLLGAATLYACAFVNFADLIARTNITMGKIDPLYLCDLGPTAAASVPRQYWVIIPEDAYDSFARACTLTPPAPQDWRNWGFRNWLVLRNLGTQEGAQ